MCAHCVFGAPLAESSPPEVVSALGLGVWGGEFYVAPATVLGREDPTDEEVQFMQTSVYDITTGQFIRSLTALKGVLAKAAQFADQKRITMEVLLGSRLAADQFPLSKQIQIACDNAKLCTARLTGVDAPKHDDKEQSYAEFVDRIDSTLAFLKSINPEQFDKFAEKTVRFSYFPGMHLTGSDYLAQYALPNFYFHLTTAYSILRHNGVDVGKGDFLGAIEWRKD